MKNLNKLKQELLIMKTNNIKPNYSELARLHKCDRRTVKKYDNGKNDIDDLISIGTIGLIKGIDTFSNKNGTRLTTYAARCIENAHLTLWNYMTYSKQHLKHYKVEYKQLIA